MRCTSFVFFTLLITVLQVQAAQAINIADLKSPDEITRIRTLWGIAEKGKSSLAIESDIVPLMNESWSGRRQAKWCFLALSKLGVPPEKNYEAFVKASLWQDKRPESVEDRQRTREEWRAKMNGPELPSELKDAQTVAWNAVVDYVVPGFDTPDWKVKGKFYKFLHDDIAPSELVVPKLAKIASNSQKTLAERKDAIVLIGMLHYCDASFEALTKALSDPDSNNRQNAVQGLMMCSRELDAYGNNDGPRRPEVVAKILPLYLKAIQTDPEMNVRSRALAATSYLTPEQYKPALGTLNDMVRTEKDPKMKGELLSSLAKMDPDTIAPIVLENLSKLESASVPGTLFAADNLLRKKKLQKQQLADKKPLIEKIAKESKDSEVKRAAESLLRTLNE